MDHGSKHRILTLTPEQMMQFLGGQGSASRAAAPGKNFPTPHDVCGHPFNHLHECADCHKRALWELKESDATLKTVEKAVSRSKPGKAGHDMLLALLEKTQHIRARVADAVLFFQQSAGACH